jgi:hypothetical protein
LPPNCNSNDFGYRGGNQAGFAIAKAGDPTPYRNNVYFVDSDGFEVEFVQYLSDLVELRNVYD